MKNPIHHSHESPKISVIMPVYNASRYVHDAIESVLKQTHQNFELIIIDDASSDDSMEILKKDAAYDSRIFIKSNEYLKGIVGALNTGLKYATGEFIARADADDINLPTRFAKQIEAFKRDPEVVLIGAACRVFSEKGFRKTIFRPSSSVELAWRLMSDTYFCHPATMFRRNIALQYHGYRQKEAEDFDFFSRIIKGNKTRNIHKVLLHYREHSTNRSKEAAQAIGLSVKTIFLDNFEYYLGTKKQADLFFAFQHDGELSVKDFLTVSKLNKRIIQKILSDYHKSYFSWDVLSCILVVLYLQCCAVVHRWILHVKTIVRPYYQKYFGKKL